MRAWSTIPAVCLLFARAEPALAQQGPTTDPDDVWSFRFNGYFRAPLRVGIGQRETATTSQSENTLHAPLIPDDQYASWQHTRHNETDWAELFFTAGNRWASGTVTVQGYNFSEASASIPKAQFGIAQGYVTLTPELPWQNFRLRWRVGSFREAYGAAGRYDAGEYDTFLFGRTHALGEALRLALDLDRTTLELEHGVGAKRPDPSVMNRARFTLLHHAHLSARWNDSIELGLHYLTSWTQEEERTDGPFDPPLRAIYFRDPATGVDPIPDGRLSVFGADVRFDLDRLGYLYAGYSRVVAEYALTVAPAIEVIHAFGGGEFASGITDNYLDSTRPTGPPSAASPCRGTIPMTTLDANWQNRVGGSGATPVCSAGNGHIDTLLGQYELSVAKLAGESSVFTAGRDLSLKLYGMLNLVRSDNLQTRGATRIFHDYRRLKFGADVMFDLFPALSLALRADRVQPNQHVPEQSFSVVSPRLVFRSALLTREQVELQYSRYVYAVRRCPADDPLGCVQAAPSGTAPDGLGATPDVTQPLDQRGAPVARPDLNVLKVQASMWW